MTDKKEPMPMLMTVTAYGVPPADGPRDIEPGPWLPTDGPVPWPQEYDDALARAMRRFG